MSETLLQQVVKVAIVLVEFTDSELEFRFPEIAWREKHKLQNAVNLLINRGLIEQVQHPVYRYIGTPAENSTLSRMWLAMKIKKVFTCQDVVIFSETRKTYVQKYVSALERLKIIFHISGQGYENAVYKLADNQLNQARH